MSGAFGKRDGDVLKLFKKTLSVNGSSPSFTIEKQGAILGYLHFLPEKSGTRLADVQKAAGSGLVYLDYFGKMVQCQVSKCSLSVPSTDGCK
jgi:hypothetical protein